LHSFDVKVLLQKYNNSDLINHAITFKSNSGFVISKNSEFIIGKHIQEDTLCISSDAHHIKINGIKYNSPCYIVPNVSLSDQKTLKKSITDWFYKYQSMLLKESVKLHTFFDTFMQKKETFTEQTYDTLFKYVQDITCLFLEDIVVDISVMSSETLKHKATLFIQYKIKELFLANLGLKQLSRKDRKSLQQIATYRYDFFTKHIHEVIQLLLYDFLLALPRNMLSEILHSEISGITYQDNTYLGVISLLKEQNFVYVINGLDIDDYLLSVIRYEGWPGWPLEVNKVLAIACRTYLVWQILQAQKTKRLYHIENGIRHQTYKGHHKYARLKKAVEETKDICIAYNSKPILAMFDSCCGGVVPAKINQLDLKKHTYLMRSKPCMYCKNCKIATWNIEFAYDDILTLLQQEIPGLQSIDQIAVTQKDEAGIVTEVTIYDKDICFKLTGKKMYSLFQGIKSFCFDIETFSNNKQFDKKVIKRRSKKKETKQVGSTTEHDIVKKVMISGNGYGHHIGLCQWGAMKLVKDFHWNYQQILDFYYPGTTLIKLKYQR
tara:strand:+ start:1417 stop:3063 length:1647 start_codon:yes stop_codon:yes gene_type:complete